MYILGFINLNDERALIDPKPCRSVDDLYIAITDFLNTKDYKLEPPITKEGIALSLKEGVPVRINITGYSVALLFGENEVIECSTDRYVHIID